MRRKRAWSQFTRSEECLACFEDHPVVYFKQLIYKEPRAIGRALQSITILKDPIPVEVFDRALQARKLVVIELNIAGGHTPNLDLLATLEGEHLVKFRSINEFQLDAIIGAIDSLTLVARIDIATSTSSASFTLEEVDSEV